MSASRQTVRRSVLAALCALVVLPPVAASDPPVPVVILGLDGLERQVVEHLWTHDQLPHLRSLAERGTLVDLATAERSRERPVWTTVATGRSSEAHGIPLDNVVETGSKPRGAGSRERQVSALWNIAHRSGLTSHVAGWPATFPAESVSGVILSDRAALSTNAQAASPPKVAASLESWVRKADDGYRDLFPSHQDGAESDRLAAWATEQALQRGAADLFMIRLRRIDRTSHRLWKYFDPEEPPSAQGPGSSEFYASYEAIDAAVGRLLAEVPAEAHVLALSAHGFKSIPESTHFKSSLVPVLQYLEHLALFAGEPEWRQTRLYVLDTPDTDPRKQLRVNLKGRETRGQVKAKHRDALLAQLEAELSSFRYAGTQAPVFLLETPATGEPGDRVVVFRQAGVSPVIEYNGTPIDGAIVSLSQLSGGHGLDTPGMLIAAGSAFQPGAHAPDVSVLDIAPLVLRLLDVPLSEELSGSVPSPLLAPTWAAAHPVRTVVSYEL